MVQSSSPKSLPDFQRVFPNEKRVVLIFTPLDFLTVFRALTVVGSVAHSSFKTDLTCSVAENVDVTLG